MIYIFHLIIYNGIGAGLLATYIAFEIRRNPFIVGEIQLLLLIPFWPIILLEIIYTNTIGRFVSNLLYSFKHRNDPIPLPEPLKYVCLFDVCSLYPAMITIKGIEEAEIGPSYESEYPNNKEDYLKMHWLIQRGFDSDRYYLQLIETLERLEVSHSFCKVVPFSDSDEGLLLETPLPEGLPVYCYGSYSLSKHAIRRGFLPGAYISNDSSMDNLLKHYGSNMLNSDMWVVPFSNDLFPNWEEMFVKPAEDTKAFVAQVMTNEEFMDFRNKIVNAEGYSTVTKDTMVCLAKPKNIEAEYRFFVVRGSVVTYSQYKIGDRVVYDSRVDQYIVDYAKKMVALYEPDDAFVIDIALTEGELKVIEVNSINSSGLYAIDLQKLVIAVDALDRPYNRNSILLTKGV